MDTRLMLRGLLEPVYRDSPSLKERLRATQGQLDRLRTTAWEHFPQLIKPHPEHIYLVLTAGCNLRCKGCRYGRDFTPGHQLALPMVRDLLDDAKELNFEVVRLYGGEPLLHKQIAEIVEHCTKIRLRSYLTTNGLLLKKKIDDLYAAGLRTVQVGLYGIGEDYNEYVQRKDRFDQLEENLEYVRERYGNKIKLTLNWLLMKPTSSIQTVRETWEFAKRFNAPICINLVHYSLPYFTEGEDRELAFTEADRPQVNAVIKEFMRLQSRDPHLLSTSAPVMHSIPDWLIKGPDMRVPCDRHRLIWVGADGLVQMCYVTFKLGNLHEKRLKDMLFTKEHTEAARNAFKLNCPNCHCAYGSRVQAHAPTREKYMTAPF